MTPAEQPPDPRPTCYQCLRPKLRCVCGWLPRVFNRTPVLIVQHPRERFHPFGTAGLAELALERAEVQVVWPRSDARGAALAFGAGDWLLYPDPQAPRIDEVFSPSAVVDVAPPPPRRLVVVDGTWHHARRLLLDVPALAALPRVRLAPTAPSRYRVRREPSAECLSTLESIVAALRIAEPDTQGFDALLAAFDAMNEQQLGLTEAHRGGPNGGRRRVRARPPKVIPAALVEHLDRCVVVYGESAAPPDGGKGRRASRFPVYFAAMRVASGEAFECVVSAGPRPSDWHLAHMGLDAGLLDRGVPIESARADWLRFLGEGGVVVAWNRSSLDLARVLGSPTGVLLKGVYCNVTRRPCSGLEQAVAEAGVTLGESPFHGRAQQRVAGGVAMARWLNRWATSES